MKPRKINYAQFFEIDYKNEIKSQKKDFLNRMPSEIEAHIVDFLSQQDQASLRGLSHGHVEYNRHSLVKVLTEVKGFVFDEETVLPELRFINGVLFAIAVLKDNGLDMPENVNIILKKSPSIAHMLGMIIRDLGDITRVSQDNFNLILDNYSGYSTKLHVIIRVMAITGLRSSENFSQLVKHIDHFSPGFSVITQYRLQDIESLTAHQLCAPISILNIPVTHANTAILSACLDGEIEPMFFLKKTGLLHNYAVVNLIIDSTNPKFVIASLARAGCLNESVLRTILPLNENAADAVKVIDILVGHDISIEQEIVDLIAKALKGVIYDSSQDSGFENELYESDKHKYASPDGELFSTIIDKLSRSQLNLLNLENFVKIATLFVNDVESARRFCHSLNAVCYSFYYTRQAEKQKMFDFLLLNAPFSKALANIILITDASSEGWSVWNDNKLDIIIRHFENKPNLLLYAKPIAQAMAILKKQESLSKRKILQLLENPKLARHFVKKWEQHLATNKSKSERVFNSVLSESKEMENKKSAVLLASKPEACQIADAERDRGPRLTM